MNRLALIFGSVALVLLALVLAGAALGVEARTDPQRWLGEPSFFTGAAGVLLLTLDVFLPVPNVPVIMAFGAFFGFVLGSALAALGTIGAGLLGVGVGRVVGRVRGVLSPDDERAARRLLARYGLVAIVLTRPLPLLAEATVVVAGITRMSVGRLLLGTTLGSIPTACLWSYLGAQAATVANPYLVIGLATVVLAGGGYMLDRLSRRALLDDQASASSPADKPAR